MPDTMPTPPTGSVVITPREMYDAMLETRDEVRRLAVLVDPAFRDHETRLRLLEKRVWIVGATAVGGGAGLAHVVNAWLGG